MKIGDIVRIKPNDHPGDNWIREHYAGHLLRVIDTGTYNDFKFESLTKTTFTTPEDNYDSYTILDWNEDYVEPLTGG
jgi:hypothetical protein